jgi:hypothetical protein
MRSLLFSEYTSPWALLQLRFQRTAGHHPKRRKNMKRNYVVCCSKLLVFFAITLTTAFGFKKENAKKIKTLSGKEITVAEMDEYLKTKMDSLNIKGISIAIINDAKVVYHRSFGIVNIY